MFIMENKLFQMDSTSVLSIRNMIITEIKIVFSIRNMRILAPIDAPINSYNQSIG